MSVHDIIKKLFKSLKLRGNNKLLILEVLIKYVIIRQHVMVNK